jgi:hypothetical protein
MPTVLTDYRFSCGWPTIWWTATPPLPGEDSIDPEQDTRYAFMDGYGYTFWVKSNVEYRVYRTGVENWDYRPDENHEPQHWFGVSAGRDGTEGKNYTRAPVGEWTQITVIYDPRHPDFNMDTNGWIKMYNIFNNFPGDTPPQKIAENHNKEHNIRLAWAIQLQHNGGNEGNEYMEYSCADGRHVYDFWFHGLEILVY